MIKIVIAVYRFLFARKCFFKLNKLFFHLSLRGMGILNYENNKISGEYHFLKSLLKGKEGATVLDVGANVGNYSKSIMQMNNKANVFAFEPNPSTFINLVQTSKEYGFSAFNAGCGEEKGKLKLYDYKEGGQGSQHASLYNEVFDDFHRKGAISVDVDVIKLDDFVKEKQIDVIDFIKIDTEGHELKVLEGLRETISKGKVKTIQIEFNFLNIISRTTFRDFSNLLKGYKFYRLLPNELLELDTSNIVMTEIYAFQNIVAILEE
jgi:FkbM family methyltransferase